MILEILFPLSLVFIYFFFVWFGFEILALKLVFFFWKTLFIWINVPATHFGKLYVLGLYALYFDFLLGLTYYIGLVNLNNKKSLKAGPMTNN